MKKIKELKIIVFIVISFIFFVVIRYNIKNSKEEPKGVSVGSYSIDMYIKHKDGTLEEVDSAPKEGNYELESKCEGIKSSWNNETHKLTLSLNSDIKDCKIIFKEL